MTNKQEGSSPIFSLEMPLSVNFAVVKYAANGHWVSGNATVLEVLAVQFYLGKCRCKPYESFEILKSSSILKKWKVNDFRWQTTSGELNKEKNIVTVTVILAATNKISQ